MKDYYYIYCSDCKEEYQIYYDADNEEPLSNCPICDSEKIKEI